MVRGLSDKKLSVVFFLPIRKKDASSRFVVVTLVSSFLDGTCSFNGVWRGINKYSVIGFADTREGNEVELKMRIVNSEWEAKKERWRGIRSKVRCWLGCFASSNPRQWKSRFINKLFMSAPQEMNREQCEEYAYWCWV